MDDGLGRLVASRIIAAREAKGWRQIRLAEASGIPQSILTNTENKGRVPNARSLIKLADALGVSVDYLLGRAEK